MLTQVLALTLVEFYNKRTEQLLCPISERCVPCFRKRQRTVRWWWMWITLSIPRSVTLHWVCHFFEKSRQRHSGVVKLSTGAIANILKKAVAPTCN